MKAPYFSDDELIIRVWDRENIRDLMSRRMYYIANEERRKELDELWVQDGANRKTACLGYNWGYYVGFDAISNAYVVGHNRRRHVELDYYCKANPGTENSRNMLGIGALQLQPLLTPLIEVALDGKTAKGAWFVFGLDASIQPDGSAIAYWTYDKLGVDFVKEEGAWKIWRLCQTTDAIVESGTAYRDQTGVMADGDLPWQQFFGAPTIPFTLHDPKLNWSDNFPPEPHEYTTMTEALTYGPSGHISLQDALRKEGRL